MYHNPISTWWSTMLVYKWLIFALLAVVKYNTLNLYKTLHLVNHLLYHIQWVLWYCRDHEMCTFLWKSTDQKPASWNYLVSFHVLFLCACSSKVLILWVACQFMCCLTCPSWKQPHLQRSPSIGRLIIGTYIVCVCRTGKWAKSMLVFIFKSI